MRIILRIHPEKVVTYRRPHRYCLTVVLRLHDTCTRTVRELLDRTRSSGNVRMRRHRPGAAAWEHIRSEWLDIVRRWLGARGYDVTYVRNVTDIDDKILHNAGHEDVPTGGDA